jgi:type IV pilus assembly protein PilY1
VGEHVGWFMDFVLDDNNNGERLISNLLLRNKRLVFSTLLPSESTCADAGSSWLMVLDATDGGRLETLVEKDGELVAKEESAFDVNNDGKLNDADYIHSASEGGIAVTGRLNDDIEFGAGILFSQPDDNSQLTASPLETAITNTSSGELEKTELNIGGENLGRQTWLQLLH